MATQITDDQFEETIKEGITLVDFWAPWCGPCKMLEPIIEEISEEYKEKMSVAKINTDENTKNPEKFGVRGIPTLILFKDGEVVERMTGAYPKAAIEELINKHV